MTTPNHKFMRGDLLIVVSALIWGVAFYFQKTAMSHVGPMLFIGMRGLVAAVVLLPFALAEQEMLPVFSRRSKSAGTLTQHRFWSGLREGLAPIAVAGGFTFFIAASLQQVGLVTATVTNTGFLTALYVIVTPFLFWVIKRIAPSAIIWLCALMSMVGVWALGGGTIINLSGGDRLIAFSALFWALLIIVSGEAAKYEKPLSYTCIQFLTVGLLGMIAALLFERDIDHEVLQALPAVLYVGVLSTALTFGLMAIALQTVPAPRASILLSLETLFAALAGYTLLGERLDLLGWFGAALILSAVAVLQYPRKND